MKVLQVVGAPSGQTGSFERHLLTVAAIGKTYGVDVGLCYPRAPVPGTTYAAALGRANIDVWARPTQGKADFGFVEWLVRLIRREHIDLLHGHFEPASDLAVLAGVLTRRPVILTRHYLASNRPASRHGFLTALAGRVARRFVAVSEPVRSSLIDFRVPARRAVTHPLGVDRTIFTPATADRRAAARGLLGIRTEIPVVVATSHHRPGKGLEVLIDAAARAQRVLVLLAGEGPLSGELQDRATALDAPVRFLGAVDDVSTMLSAADIFCFPTVDYPDGLPMAVIEAMACGLPIVASPVPALVGLIDGADPAGVLVPAADAHGLAAAFDRLSDDPVRRAKLGRAGIARSADFDLERCATDMVNLYAEVLRAG